MPSNTLVIVVGQEGSGKSTTLRAVAPQIPFSARIDAEDLSYITPWSLDDAALTLLWTNVAALTHNYWAAGFHNMVAGSFLSNIDHYRRFRDILNAPAETYLIHLCAQKPARDTRRIERAKPSTQEWRDHVDTIDPEDSTFASAADHADYRYLRLDNDTLTVEQTIDHIRTWAPALFTASEPLPAPTHPVKPRAYPVS